MTSVQMNYDFDGENDVENYDNNWSGYSKCVTDTILEEIKRRNPTIANQTKFGRMLDVGCGGGALSTFTLEPYFDSILGIDVSPNMIALAKAKNKSPNIEFQVVNDNYFPVEDESVDFINSAGTGTFLDMDVFTRECERVLKPNGCVAVYTAVSVGIKYQWPTKPGTTKEYYKEYMELQRKYMADCKGDPIYERWMNLYKDCFDEVKNPTKRYANIPRVSKKYTLAQLKMLWSIYGFYLSYRKKEKVDEKDPLEKITSGLKSLLGLEEENDDDKINLLVVFEHPLLLFHKQ